MMDDGIEWKASELCAYDIVLVSKSRSGTQTLLERLDVYCNKWLLNVNIEKTKIIICNKNGKMLKEFQHEW